MAEIQALEKRGDEIDREINQRLEDAFITPFDREDIHELTVRLDDVVDGIQAMAETLVIYDIEQPTEEARELARILAEQSVELLAALRKLDGLKDLDAHLVLVHDLEHEADGLSRAAIGRLFREGRRRSRSSSGATCIASSRTRSMPPRMPPRRSSGCTTRRPKERQAAIPDPPRSDGGRRSPRREPCG